jgi:hypothetical protein
MFVLSAGSVNRSCIFNVLFLQGFKISQTFVTKKIILSMVTGFNKWLFMFLAPAVFYMSGNIHDKKSSSFHPLHVSVTEINHNAADKTLEISCRMFTDDFEKVLAQNYKTKVDLINPPDKPAMEKLVNDFVQKHLGIKADDKSVSFTYLGYERDNDAVYSYFQVDNISAVKKIGITNNIMHELFTDQINLMHTTVGGKRKSVKLDYPEKEAVLNF